MPPAASESLLPPTWLVSREEEFQAQEAGLCDPTVAAALMWRRTPENMTILQIYFRQDRDEVLDNLLAFVCAIWPEIHENYRING
ncbi:hypothetical protein K5549_021943 [Capra hircus]|nr:hypothetical protein K5549_021943 [Capra hircus]